MEYLIIFAVIIVAAIVLLSKRNNQVEKATKADNKYKYAPKERFMTTSEAEFFKVLSAVTKDRYYVFPQVHLSALFENKTVGRYYRAAFNSINGRSVDYVLCDRVTLLPVYAVELDDWTHGSAKRQKRDKEVNSMFKEAKIPLVRFSNYKNLTEDDIIQRFADARNDTTVI